MPVQPQRPGDDRGPESQGGDEPVARARPPRRRAASAIAIISVRGRHRSFGILGPSVFPDHLTGSADRPAEHLTILVTESPAPLLGILRPRRARLIFYPGDAPVLTRAAVGRVLPAAKGVTRRVHTCAASSRAIPEVATSHRCNGDLTSGTGRGQPPACCRSRPSTRLYPPQSLTPPARQGPRGAEPSFGACAVG